MGKPKIPYDYIAIEGNIGAGKTSFAHQLQSDYNCKLILEQFDQNPFLPLFYQDPDRHAFTVEIFFMTERFKQMKSEMQSQDMFTEFVVSDYTFIKTLLFARKNLEEEEFKLFQILYNVISTNLPGPDLLVYFHRNVDILMANIQKRDRSFEKDITEEYLLGVQNAYFEYFRNILSYPILIIDLKDIDFISSPQNYEIVRGLIAQPYKPGVHRISLSV